ncbi:MAG: hypothetical protein ACYDAG_06495 [Chloroflexota bacterium]
MCDSADEAGIVVDPDAQGRASPVPTIELDELESMLGNARALAERPERRTSHVGFVGYGDTKAGDKVLIAVDREYDAAVPDVIARALREKGAKVDVLVLDMGDPNKEFDELDELGVTMRREPWENNPRRWSRILPNAAATTCSSMERAAPCPRRPIGTSKSHGCKRSISPRNRPPTPLTCTS